MTEKVVYDTQRAVADLLSVQREAMELDENGRMRDRRAAIQATVEALKVQGKYVAHSESVRVQVTTEDRMRAKVLGLGLNEYVRRKEEGTLPPLPATALAG
ncbi:MAG: hypothetical protein U5R46_12010 [Gammaproteobacteria bacterium]|nr:hypothetical protein [Gammaproteobacteria bacterium]